VTSVPTGLSVPCGMLAVAIPGMRLPLVLIVVVAFFTSTAVLPLLVLTGVVSYLICHDQPELRDAAVPTDQTGVSPRPGPGRGTRGDAPRTPG
jgi:nitrate/nitrite transporter NarK